MFTLEWLQVSFFRSNLVLRVVKKPTGRTPDGKPAVLDALVNYIGCALVYLLAHAHVVLIARLYRH